MKTKGYLIVGQNGSLRAVKSMRGPVSHDGIAVAVDIAIPDAAFKPVIQATIKINEEDVRPVLIGAGKLNKAAEVLSNEIGFDVVLKSVKPHEKKKTN